MDEDKMTKIAFLSKKTEREISNAEALILAKSSLQTALAGVEALLEAGVNLDYCKAIFGGCIYLEIDRARQLLDDLHGTVLTSLKMKDWRENGVPEEEKITEEDLF